MLKWLCPFEIGFKLKVFSNRNNHDYAILFQATGDEPFIEDPRDLESFIAQIKAAREIETQFTVRQVRYEGEVYFCIYIDFKKET